MHFSEPFISNSLCFLSKEIQKNVRSYMLFIEISKIAQFF